jgi:hypothetical protein
MNIRAVVRALDHKREGQAVSAGLGQPRADPPFGAASTLSLLTNSGVPIRLFCAD